jgi:hypothetical protein
VIEDVIRQRREYVTFGKDEKDAAEHIKQGLFIVESEAATLDTVDSVVVSSERIGTVDEG